MSTAKLFVTHESNIGSKHHVSVRGDGRIPRNIYDRYLDRFVLKQSGNIIYRSTTTLLYPRKDITEWCTILSLKHGLGLSGNSLFIHHELVTLNESVDELTPRTEYVDESTPRSKCPDDACILL